MKLERRDSRRERKFAIVLVVMLILVVIFTMAIASYFSPKNRATRELERMAEEYYETYLYGSSISTLENGSEGMAEISEKGVQPVKLRQLLLYDSGRNRRSQDLFDTEAYRCDLDRSEVVYHPMEPYGVKDYTIEYNTACRESDW